MRNEDELKAIDRARFEEAERLRKTANVAAIVYAEYFGSLFNFDRLTKLSIANSILKREWEGRAEILDFTNIVEDLMISGDPKCNPGANESNLAFATRRLTLIKKFILFGLDTNFPDKIDTTLIPLAVDGYIRMTGLGLNNLSITKK